MENPFDCGSGPVKPEKFIGRDNEIQTIAQGLREKSSFVVVGEPKSGKTSLLNYLSAREKRDQLYKRQASHLIFNYLDIQSRLNPLFTPQGFWLWALQPVTENLSNISDVMRHYKLCKANRFTVSKLERLFKTLEDLGWKLVLLIDEFDNVLQHPNLNSAEFYGGIRSLSTRFESLSIVLATRTRKKVLKNRLERSLGSPFLNFAQERILPPLTDDSINGSFAKVTP